MKTKISFAWYWGFIFGVGFKNTNPRKKCNTSDIDIIIIIPFVGFNYNITYPYKKFNAYKK